MTDVENELGLQHIDKALVADAPTAEYRWHRYWTRKPHNVVGEYIEHYSHPGEFVLDPFSGSGVTVAEAVRRGRLGIGIDIVPPAIDLLRATLVPVDLDALDRAFKQLRSEVKDEIERLYLTTCAKCQAEVPFVCMTWVADEPAEIRYQCANCGFREPGASPTRRDLRLVAKLDRQPISKWYPTNRLVYPDGTPFMKGENHESIDSLFTRRGLHALSTLLGAINALPDDVRPFLKMAFSSMVHLASKLTPVREARPFAAFWAQHSYWVPPEGYMEMNVWHLFDSAYRGKQGLRKAKAATNGSLGDVREARTMKQLGQGGTKFIAFRNSALLALRGMPDDCIDYVFTDPPYGASIQFGELSYIWVSWLHPEIDPNTYLKQLMDDEVVLNDSQGKPFDRYYSLLYAVFQEVFRVLKPGRYMTVTFHNPKTRIRNATIRAAAFSGFDYQKIIYQPPAITSYKSLLQPFGSADGDFFFRFQKPRRVASTRLEEADKDTFERIVVETATQVLAERGEPTPFTHIINYVDPVLARHGYFLSLNPEVDVDDVLRAHTGTGREFRLVETTINKVKGQAWWFQDIDAVYRLKELPLSERVESTVLRLLRRRHTIDFTEALNAVFTEFPNSLTPDSTDVKDVLKEYAEQAANGLWRLKQAIEAEQTAHSEMIYILGRIGHRLGYQVWIGKPEQSQSWMMTRLETLVTKGKPSFKGASPAQEAHINMIDVVWHRAGVIEYAFEVENTTMLTEALVRCSNISSPNVPRFMVIPLSRNGLFHRKMGSPLFAEMFSRENWTVLYYEDVREVGKQTRVSLDDLLNKAGIKPPELVQTDRLPVRRTKPKLQLPFESL